MKTLLLALFLSLFSYRVNATPTFNFDFSLDRSSFSTEDANGNETDGDSFDKFYSFAVLFGEGIQYGVFYHLEDYDNSTKRSLFGAMVTLGDRFFLDLGAGQYKTDQGFISSETGLGFILRPGVQFQTGSSTFIRASIPYFYGSAENDNGFKISRSSLRPYVGFGLSF